MTNEELVREGLVSIEEAMEFLSMSRASLYRLIDGGALVTVKLACAGYRGGRSSTLRRYMSSRRKAVRPEYGRAPTIGSGHVNKGSYPSIEESGEGDRYSLAASTDIAPHTSTNTGMH